MGDYNLLYQPPCMNIEGNIPHIIGVATIPLASFPGLSKEAIILQINTHFMEEGFLFLCVSGRELPQECSLVPGLPRCARFNYAWAGNICF